MTEEFYIGIFQYIGKSPHPRRGMLEIAIKD